MKRWVAAERKAGRLNAMRPRDITAPTTVNRQEESNGYDQN